MPRARRTSGLVLLLAALVPAALAGGIYLGGHADLLPSPVRDALVSDDDARLLDEALDVISRDYYRKVNRDQLVNASLGEAVKRLDDRFSNYFDPGTYRHFREATSGRFSGVGVSVEEVRQGLRIGEVFAGSPASRAGLRVDDLIVAVDGRSIRGVSSRASTALIQGRLGTEVALTIQRGEERLVRRMKRARVDVPVVSSRLRRAGEARVGVVHLESFTSGAHGEVRRAVDRALKRGARGIVLDLRGNGGGLLDEAVLVSSVFIEKGRIVSTRGRSRPRRNYDAVGSAISAKIPVVVLVDGGTASAAEIVTGALKDRRKARVVGRRTFGKGVFQEIEELSNGGALDITVGQYFLPSGRNLGGAGVKRGAGIVPDVPARDLPRTARDEALDVALRTLAAEVR